MSAPRMTREARFNPPCMLRIGQHVVVTDETPGDAARVGSVTHVGKVFVTILNALGATRRVHASRVAKLYD